VRSHPPRIGDRCALFQVKNVFSFEEMRGKRGKMEGEDGVKEGHEG
jgi:hypothetical protein